MQTIKKADFTLPGETGYEKLTLSLAKRWGADVIRDSDGTILSDEILQSGYSIYSTLCIVRDHNDFLQAHPQYQQQCFLLSHPLTAGEGSLAIPLMEGYFEQQLQVNDTPEALVYWQVHNRTTGQALPRAAWCYDAASGTVVITKPQPWHQYTASFLAWRIWEEISMYNHVTNHWDKEHLMQLDPVYPEAQSYLLDYMERWCAGHPQTSVVRFTSLFYNFAWVWGADERNRTLFTDWGSYDFTVSPHMLENFEKACGYALTAEDFLHGGLRCPSHMAPNKKLRDYMAFVQDFVIAFGSQLVDITHRHGKEAYLFYDDSWVGSEPGSKRFAEFGFDGIIKCVFSGFEARLCSAVEGVKTHELRLHPYLFPVGLGGMPTFSPGGHPGVDALEFWTGVRRALLRQPVDRLGLGGYLHLVEAYPDFVAAMDQITTEFAQIKALHAAGAPAVASCRIGIATSWGRLRRWTCGGHYHEHPDLDLLNLLESLAGMPFEVEFLSLEELAENGVPEGIDLLINAGFAGSAWSGGDAWNNPALSAAVTAWVQKGGTLLGVGQPSAVPGRAQVFQLAHLLGVDDDQPALLCHGRWETPVSGEGWPSITMDAPAAVRLLHGGVQLLQANEKGQPQMTRQAFHKGQGVYLAQYCHTAANACSLHRLLLRLVGLAEQQAPDAATEHHLFPASKTVVLLNNTGKAHTGKALIEGQEYTAELAPYGMQLIPL